MTRRLLFLCHANVVRSPAAELLSAANPDLTGEWDFTSAGVRALSGHHVDADMAAALLQHGVDATVRRGARQYNSGDIDQADLILAFERAHRDDVITHHDGAARRTLTIRRAAQLLSDPPRRAEGVSLCLNDDRGYTAADDFADPVGQGRAAAVAAAAEISELLDIILPALGAIRR